MNVKALTIPEVLLIEPKLYKDQRGFNYESFNVNDFEKITKEKQAFVQDNFSQSVKGVLRGLHYQLPPTAQGKLITVLQGEIFDVAVDIRRNSKTFGRWVGVKLSSKNRYQLWVPVGFAHGFVALSETTEVMYKLTNYYSPKDERCISWSDPTINITWPSDIEIILSDRDTNGKELTNVEVFT